MRLQNAFCVHDTKKVVLAFGAFFLFAAVLDVTVFGQTKRLVQSTSSAFKVGPNDFQFRIEEKEENAGHVEEFLSSPETDVEKYKDKYQDRLANCQVTNSVTWDQFYDYLPQTGGCRKMLSFGGHLFRKNIFEGHKLVCMEEPVALVRNDCTVMSVGISSDWSFDDAMDRYGCKVYSFDPTIGRKEFKRSENIHFYPIGLSGKTEDKKSKKGKMQKFMTFRSLLEHIGLLGRTVDYLKMDIEGSEMDVFENIFQTDPQLLHNVKQIGMEIHPSTTPTRRNRLWRIAHQLQCLSFVPVFYEKNPMNLRRYKKGMQSCCYELVWINKLYGTTP